MFDPMLAIGAALLILAIGGIAVAGWWLWNSRYYKKED